MVLKGAGLVSAKHFDIVLTITDLKVSNIGEPRMANEIKGISEFPIPFSLPK
jgi:hypothetical protein